MRARNFFSKFLGYFDFTRTFRGEQQPHNDNPELDSGSKTNLRLMHGTNRLSIFMFVICLIILFYKLVLR